MAEEHSTEKRRLEADDLLELGRTSPLLVNDVGGVTLDNVSDEDGNLVADVSAFTLERGVVSCVTMERRVVVAATHRFDPPRLSLWWNRTRAALQDHCRSQLRDMGFELDVGQIVPGATATVRGFGPWPATGTTRWTLRNRLPAWAGKGATIVRLPDRDAVYCDDELQFDVESAFQSGYGAIPCLKGFVGPKGARQSRGRERERTAKILAQAACDADALLDAWRGARTQSQTWAAPAGTARREPITGCLWVPARSELEALAALRFGDFNDCPSTSVIIAVLRRWKEHFGAHVDGLCFDTLKIHLQQPPEAADVARAWFEVNQLMPDDYPQDPAERDWQLWWD